MREASAVVDGPGRPSIVEVLAELASAVHGARPVDDKLAWVAEALRSLTGAELAAYTGIGPGTADVVAVAGDAPARVYSEMAAVVAQVAGPDAAGRPWPMRAIDLHRLRRWRRVLDAADLPDDAAVLGVPVWSSDGILHGVLVACHPDADHFGPEDEAEAGLLAGHLGVALDNERHVADLEEIREVQREVVHQLDQAVRPPVPTVEGAELGVHHLPADESAPTGGDLHDWMVLPDGDVFLAVVDVMGKGVAATKGALAVTHALRLLVLDGCPIDRLVARADRLLTAHSPDLVATVIVARYRPADGRVWLAGGGQPPALWVSAEGEVQLVPAPGIAVGWPGAGSAEVVELTLDRNDSLVLYTDGLIESTKDVIAGLEKLQREAAQIAKYPSRNVARSLVERSLAGAMRRDDSLALVLRRRTPPPAEAGTPLGPFEYRFSPLSATVPLGRRLFADWLDHLPLEAGERADLLLVASELSSNAIRHASGAPGALVLRAWWEGDSIVIELEDDGDGFEPDVHYDTDLPDADLERGRGLFVVDALADEWSVRRENDRTVVRVVRRAILPVAG